MALPPSRFTFKPPAVAADGPSLLCLLGARTRWMDSTPWLIVQTDGITLRESLINVGGPSFAAWFIDLGKGVGSLTLSDGTSQAVLNVT